MPFETWLEQKKEQDRTLRKLRRQIRQDEKQKMIEKEEELKSKMTFEDWM